MFDPRFKAAVELKAGRHSTFSTEVKHAVKLAQILHCNKGDHFEQSLPDNILSPRQSLPSILAPRNSRNSAGGDSVTVEDLYQTPQLVLMVRDSGTSKAETDTNKSKKNRNKCEKSSKSEKVVVDDGGTYTVDKSAAGGDEKANVSGVAPLDSSESRARSGNIDELKSWTDPFEEGGKIRPGLFNDFPFGHELGSRKLDSGQWLKQGTIDFSYIAWWLSSSVCSNLRRKGQIVAPFLLRLVTTALMSDEQTGCFGIIRSLTKV